MRRATLALFALVSSGCYHPNEAVGVPCAANLECPSGQVCDTSKNPPTCERSLTDAPGPDTPIVLDSSIDAPPVGCTTSAMCPGSAPYCDPNTGVCRGCEADAECGSFQVCTEHLGTCVPDAAAIFVVAAGGSDAAACTRAAPCATISHALTLVTATRYVVRVGNGAYTDGQIHLQSNLTATLSGETSDPTQATLTVAVNPSVLSDGGSTLVLEGFTVTGGTGIGVRANGALTVYRCAITNNGGDGILALGTSTKILQSTIKGNTGLGLDCLPNGTSTTSGTLMIDRDYILGNLGGGIYARTIAPHIVNCMIGGNGAAGAGGSTYGGIRIENVASGSVVAFDTVAQNNDSGQWAPGVSSASAATVNDSILVGNGGDNSIGSQLGAMVTAQWSLFESPTVPPGTGNKLGNPQFVSPTTNDFHIMATSAANDAANPAATVHIDLDGNPRPQGAGYDMGACEVP